jgi:hypothetical protein
LWREHRGVLFEYVMCCGCCQWLDGVRAGIRKYQEYVRQAIHHIRQRLPCPLLGVDSDSGGEFINQCLYNYCRKEKIYFTRSRPYKKNDSCYVEQKNGNVVRRLVGYDRYDTRTAYECLQRLYNCVRLYTNFFQPNTKLLSKT